MLMLLEIQVKNMNIFAVKKVAASNLTACSKNQKKNERNR